MALVTMAIAKSQGGPTSTSYKLPSPTSSSLGAATPSFLDDVLPIRVSEGDWG